MRSIALPLDGRIAVTQKLREMNFTFKTISKAVGIEERSLYKYMSRRFKSEYWERVSPLIDQLVAEKLHDIISTAIGLEPDRLPSTKIAVVYSHEEFEKLIREEMKERDQINRNVSPQNDKRSETYREPPGRSERFDNFTVEWR